MFESFTESFEEFHIPQANSDISTILHYQLVFSLLLFVMQSKICLLIIKLSLMRNFSHKKTKIAF